MIIIKDQLNYQLVTMRSRISNITYVTQFDLLESYTNIVLSRELFKLFVSTTTGTQNFMRTTTFKQIKKWYFFLKKSVQNQHSNMLHLKIENNTKNGWVWKNLKH